MVVVGGNEREKKNMIAKKIKFLIRTLKSSFEKKKKSKIFKNTLLKSTTLPSFSLYLHNALEMMNEFGNELH